MHVEWLLICELIIAVGFIAIGEMDYQAGIVFERDRPNVFSKVGFVTLAAFVSSLIVWLAS